MLDEIISQALPDLLAFALQLKHTKLWLCIHIITSNCTIGAYASPVFYISYSVNYRNKTMSENSEKYYFLPKEYINAQETAQIIGFIIRGLMDDINQKLFEFDTEKRSPTIIDFADSNDEQVQTITISRELYNWLPDNLKKHFLKAR